MATSNYSWNLPTVGGSEDAWGTQLNANWTALDTLLGGTNSTEFAILDGATVTTTELNYLSGVTGAVQTQINGKAATSTLISAGAGLTGGGDLSANRTISHADTSSQGSVINSGTTFIQSITLDTYGHITALTSAGVPGASDPTTAQVAAATAGIAVNAVGSYAFLGLNVQVSVSPGSTIAGSSLRYANVLRRATSNSSAQWETSLLADVQSIGINSAVSGTWRCMGYAPFYSSGGDIYAYPATLWLRIS